MAELDPVTQQKCLETDINAVPLSWRHWRIVITASCGQALGSALATLVGIVIPMMAIVGTPHLSHAESGALAAVSLVGITMGSIYLGRLSDDIGYLKIFRFCPLLVLGASLAVCLFPYLPVLIIGLFLMGFGVGGEYSLDSDYISELMPEKWAPFMVAFAKAFSCVGGILMAGACWLVLQTGPQPTVWPDLFLWISIFAFLMFLSRIPFRESPKWLLDHGRDYEAQETMVYFLGPQVLKMEICTEPKVKTGERIETSEIRNRLCLGCERISFWDLFKKENRVRVILTGIPWACEGIGVYGVGVFLPSLIMALGLNAGHVDGSGLSISSLTVSVETSIWVNCFILPGFAAGLFLIKRCSPFKLLSWGFVFSTVGILILMASHAWKLGNEWTLIGFFIFEFFLNMGPHLMTYVLPSRVYPVADRGEGAGVAAACGKIGAVLGVFGFPILLASGGTLLVLGFTAGVQLLGALVTFVFAPLYLKSRKTSQ